MKELDIATALSKLDYTIYFDLKNLSIPSNQEAILYYMIEEGVIERQDNGKCAITNFCDRGRNYNRGV